MGPIFKESGGGTLYITSGTFTDCLYKHVRCEQEIRTLWSLRGQWAKLESTDWTVPQAYVQSAGGGIVGYIMKKAAGEPLWKLSSSANWAFQLPQVIARVVRSMAAAMDEGIFPLVEHGGNVLVHRHEGTHRADVYLIDVDGCEQMTPSRTAVDALRQLEMIS